MQIVVVHGGVSFSNKNDLHKRCADALRQAKKAAGVVDVVALLEEDELFNAGRGSNLSREGTVECEAAVMMTSPSYDGVLFGGMGATGRVKHPVRAAAALALDTHQAARGLVQPLVLVGKGAESWAALNGIPLCSRSSLVTERSVRVWKRAMKVAGLRQDNENISSDEEAENVEGNEDNEDLFSSPPLDTVGGVQMDLSSSTCVACVSSGGISLKLAGRLGHSTVYGAAMWVEERSMVQAGVGRVIRVCVSLSGCGEAIVQTSLAKGLARAVILREADSLVVPAITEHFQHSFSSSASELRGWRADRLVGGGVALVWEKTETVDVDASHDHSFPDDADECVDVVVFHNSPFLPVAYRDRRGKVRSFLSCLPEGSSFQCTAFPL